MLNKLLTCIVFGITFFIGSQYVCTSSVHANVRAGNAVVSEHSIKEVNGHIEVKVLYDGARHPTFLGFRQNGDTWQYGDIAGIECGISSWENVSDSKSANDILYVVLQYI